jgi:hypothetical protein
MAGCHSGAGHGGGDDRHPRSAAVSLAHRISP